MPLCTILEVTEMKPAEAYDLAYGAACGSQTSPMCYVQHTLTLVLYAAYGGWSWSGVCCMQGWAACGAGLGQVPCRACIWTIPLATCIGWLCVLPIAHMPVPALHSVWSMHQSGSTCHIHPQSQISLIALYYTNSYWYLAAGCKCLVKH